MSTKQQTDPRVFRDLTMIGGHPALNFLNTVKYRGKDDPCDRLESMRDVVEWATVSGLLSTAELKEALSLVAGTGHELRLLNKLRVFREQTRMLFPGAESGKPGGDDAIQVVESAINKLKPTATISNRTGSLSWTIPVTCLDSVCARIVSSVADLLLTRQSLTIKMCSGCDCDWLFIDKTKARRRCWCDSRTCGNLARVRRFREST